MKDELEKILATSKEEVLQACLPLFDPQIDKASVGDYVSDIRKGLSFLLKTVSIDIRIHDVSKEELRREIDQGKSLQQILGITDHDIEALYQAALPLFKGKHPKLTRCVFLFLTVLSPNLYSFWLGLAASVWGLGEIEEAKKIYQRAIILGHASPEPYFYAGKFYKAIKEPLKAKELFYQAVEKSRGHEELEALHKLAEGELYPN